MGLDMYLYKEHYYGGQYRGNGGHKGEHTLELDGDFAKNISLDKVISIRELGFYWRKANQIHKWFVDNIQNGEDDCKEYYVERYELETLLALCKKTQKAFKDKDYAMVEMLMPTESGFFFGSQEIDEYYLQDIEETIEALEKIISSEHTDFFYRASW